LPSGAPVKIAASSGAGSVWVEWRDKTKYRGMGHVNKALDIPPDNQLTGDCAIKKNKNNGKSICQALELNHATPRGKNKPNSGFLVLKPTAAAGAASLQQSVNDMITACAGIPELVKFKADLRKVSSPA
jgi:hypothetical protein